MQFRRHDARLLLLLRTKFETRTASTASICIVRAVWRIDKRFLWLHPFNCAWRIVGKTFVSIVDGEKGMQEKLFFRRKSIALRYHCSIGLGTDHVGAPRELPVKELVDSGALRAREPCWMGNSVRLAKVFNHTRPFAFHFLVEWGVQVPNERLEDVQRTWGSGILIKHQRRNEES